MLRNNRTVFYQEKIIRAGNNAVLGDVPCGISEGLKLKLKIITKLIGFLVKCIMDFDLASLNSMYIIHYV